MNDEPQLQILQVPSERLELRDSDSSQAFFSSWARPAQVQAPGGLVLHLSHLVHSSTSVLVSSRRVFFGFGDDYLSLVELT